MPIFLPTKQIVDHRVIEDYFRIVDAEAKRQHFSTEVFPIMGDLLAGDILDSLREGSTTHYEFAVRNTNFDFMKYTESGEEGESVRKLSFVSHKSIDKQIVNAYRNWFRDMGQSVASKYVHNATIAALAVADDKRWKEYNDYAKRDMRNNEMKHLETILKRDTYQSLFKQIELWSVEREAKKFEAKYKIPGMEYTFAKALKEIESGSHSAKKLYSNLVKLHDGFRFR